MTRLLTAVEMAESMIRLDTLGAKCNLIRSVESYTMDTMRWYAQASFERDGTRLEFIAWAATANEAWSAMWEKACKLMDIPEVTKVIAPKILDAPEVVEEVKPPPIPVAGLPGSDEDPII